VMNKTTVNSEPQLSIFDVVCASKLKAGDVILWIRDDIDYSPIAKPYLVINSRRTTGEPVITFLNVEDNEMYTHYTFSEAFLRRCKKV